MLPTIPIGKTLKSFGHRGAMKVIIDDFFVDDWRVNNTILLELQGDLVPFFVSNKEEEQDFWIVQFDDVATPEEAKALCPKTVFGLQREYKQRDKQQLPKELEILSEYQIKDQNSGLTFPIKQVEEYPQQLMATAILEGKDLLIPLVEDLITHINHEDRIISMDLPDGLLDM